MSQQIEFKQDSYRLKTKIFLCINLKWISALLRFDEQLKRLSGRREKKKKTRKVSSSVGLAAYREKYDNSFTATITSSKNSFHSAVISNSKGCDHYDRSKNVTQQLCHTIEMTLKLNDVQLGNAVFLGASPVRI